MDAGAIHREWLDAGRRRAGELGESHLRHFHQRTGTRRRWPAPLQQIRTPLLHHLPAMKTILRKCIIVVTCGLIVVGTIRGAEIEDSVAKLRVEIEKSAAEAKVTKSSSSSSSYENERLLGRLESALAKETYEEADQVLNQLAVARLTPEAKQLINQLQRAVPRAAEERQKALIAQIGAATEQAGKACLAAKHERDLDAALSELNALRSRRSEGSISDQRTRLNARLDGAIRFITRWQD